MFIFEDSSEGCKVAWTRVHAACVHDAGDGNAGKDAKKRKSRKEKKKAKRGQLVFHLHFLYIQM